MTILAGKTTITESALQILEKNNNNNNNNDNIIFRCIGLDLDVCIPQWMKDNFSKGIYPTLKERQEFAKDCCDYVTNQCHCTQKENLDEKLVAIVSFR